MGDLLLIHGGAPTAVINSSLYGAICEARHSKEISHILASRAGIAGLWSNRFIDLTDIPQSRLELLKSTPGSAIGTGRDHLEPEDYEKLAELLEKRKISYVLMTGGNGTMDTCRKLSQACAPRGIVVDGIPKTMDNDLEGTDHSPGYPSAARFIAGSVKEVAQDVKGLAIHVVVIETFGRDAGWITASSALARENPGDAPHMILYPEIPFDEAKFLKRVKELFEKNGEVVVVASEGLRYADGTPIVEPVFSVGRSVYFGDVAAYLSQLIMKKLGIKARNEKPGILGRASGMWASEIDKEEAIACGRKAVQLVLQGKQAYMPVIHRISTDPYQSVVDAVPIDDSVLQAKAMPAAYLDPDTYDVNDAFVDWLRPLIKPELPSYVSFLDDKEIKR
jgi:6-phosphofructokinase 1